MSEVDSTQLKAASSTDLKNGKSSHPSAASDVINSAFILSIPIGGIMFAASRGRGTVVKVASLVGTVLLSGCAAWLLHLRIGRRKAGEAAASPPNEEASSAQHGTPCPLPISQKTENCISDAHQVVNENWSEPYNPRPKQFADGLRSKPAGEVEPPGRTI